MAEDIECDYEVLKERMLAKKIYFELTYFKVFALIIVAFQAKTINQISASSAAIYRTQPNYSSPSPSSQRTSMIANERHHCTSLLLFGKAATSYSAASTDVLSICALE